MSWTIILLIAFAIGIVVGLIERRNYSLSITVFFIILFLIAGASVITVFADSLWHGIILFFALVIPYFVGEEMAGLSDSVIRHGSYKWTLRCTKCGCKKLHIDKEEDCVVVCSCPNCGDRNQVHMLTIK
ncbi:MAG: hypothetical protein IJS63_05340 [Bacteroidaceae bacterium]|nr:hypothetical protein [Bacteroidaceae bacterium]